MGSRLLKLALGILILAAALFGCARNYSLSCTRLESGRVTCSRSAELFGLRLGEETVEGLVRAEVRSCAGYEGATGYVVAFLTDRGKTVALVPGCYSGPGVRDARLETADEINHYLENPAQKTLQIKTAIPLINLIFLGLIVYVAIKLLRDGPQDEGDAHDNRSAL